MLGAIAGDIIGFVYEWDNIKSKEFDLFSPEAFFTDDSVLTVALAEAILNEDNYGQVMKKYYDRYPDAGYGAHFINGPKDLISNLTIAGATARR